MTNLLRVTSVNLKTLTVELEDALNAVRYTVQWDPTYWSNIYGELFPEIGEYIEDLIIPCGYSPTSRFKYTEVGQATYGYDDVGLREHFSKEKQCTHVWVETMGFSKVYIDCSICGAKKG